MLLSHTQNRRIGGVIALTDRERKMLAYLARMLWKISIGQNLDHNEDQSLDNIADELGFNEIDEKEFRW